MSFRTDFGGTYYGSSVRSLANNFANKSRDYGPSPIRSSYARQLADNSSSSAIKPGGYSSAISNRFSSSGIGRSGSEYSINSGYTSDYNSLSRRPSGKTSRDVSPVRNTTGTSNYVSNFANRFSSSGRETPMRTASFGVDYTKRSTTPAVRDTSSASRFSNYTSNTRRPSYSSRRNSVDDETSVFSEADTENEAGNTIKTDNKNAYGRTKKDDIHLPPPKTPKIPPSSGTKDSYAAPTYSQKGSSNYGSYQDKDYRSRLGSGRSSWRDAVYGTETTTESSRKVSESSELDTLEVSPRSQFLARKKERERERKKEIEKELDQLQSDKQNREKMKEQKELDYQRELQKEKKERELKKEREKLRELEKEKDNATILARQKTIQKMSERIAYKDSIEKVADWQRKLQAKPSETKDLSYQNNESPNKYQTYNRNQTNEKVNFKDDKVNEESLRSTPTGGVSKTLSDERTLTCSSPVQRNQHNRRNRRHRINNAQESESEEENIPHHHPQRKHNQRKRSQSVEDREYYTTRHDDIDVILKSKYNSQMFKSSPTAMDAIKLLQSQGSFLYDEYYTTDTSNDEVSGESTKEMAETLVYKSRKAKEIFELMPVQLQHMIIRSKGKRIRFKDLLNMCRNENYQRKFEGEEEKQFRGYSSAKQLLIELGIDLVKLEECVLQIYRFSDSQAEFGPYLDLDSTLDEQWEDMEEYTEIRKCAIILRTKLVVRVKAIIEKLSSATGRELRRALFSLKQIFQDDKDLVHEFVTNGGLDCLIRVGNEADQNYQNYILRALGQVMLYVDGMNGAINHPATIQWLYSLTASRYRLVVKTALKLLLLFVEYSENNSLLFAQSVTDVHRFKGGKPWSYIMDILGEKDGCDTELLTYTATLINKTLSATPDQDTFYDVTDCLESQGMEAIIQHHMSKKSGDMDLLEQFQIYEAALKHEDGEEDLPVSKDNLRQVPRVKSEANDQKSVRKSGRSVSAQSSQEKQTSSGRPVARDSRQKSNAGDSQSSSKNITNNSKTSHDDTETPISSHPAASKTSTSQIKLTNSNQKSNSTENKPSEPKVRITRQAAVVKDPQQPSLEESKTLTEEDVKPSLSTETTPQAQNTTPVVPEPQTQASTPGKISSTAKDAIQNSLQNPPGKSAASSVAGTTGPSQSQVVPKTPEPAKKTEEELIWERIERDIKKDKIKIKDLDFSDLTKSDDEDACISSISVPLVSAGGVPPPPPPPPGGAIPPPPPSIPPPPSFGRGFPPPLAAGLPPKSGENTSSKDLPPGTGLPKSKKTVRLHWPEFKHDVINPPPSAPKASKSSIWTHLKPVTIDPEKLELLFENKTADTKVKKQETTHAKKIVVLDMKRSNAINIGMTVLPPPRTIKTAILKMDSSIINREGIEKLLNTMIPSEEEKDAIIQAQVANQTEGITLGAAEQFLLTLSSISHLKQRLELWLFKVDYEQMEKDIAEPLQDLKQGINEVRVCKTLRYIISLLLGIGNFLNGSATRGFSFDYLNKLPEVKDTQHKHSLLYHICNMVIDQFPDSKDLYSELGSICRCRRVDWDELALKLEKLEKDCKKAWRNHKEINKTDGAHTQQGFKMAEFLNDTTGRIILLKIVYNRVLNKFRSLLLFLGYSMDQTRKTTISNFVRPLAEFALEYRTTRERVIQQRDKKQSAKERRRTRGKFIFDMDNNNSNQPVNTEDESLKQLLKASDYDSDASYQSLQRPKKQDNRSKSRNSLQPSPSPQRSNRTNMGRSSPMGSDVSDVYDTEQDEILDACVRTVTSGNTRRQQNPEKRKAANKERRSYRRTLVNGISQEDFNSALSAQVK